MKGAAAGAALMGLGMVGLIGLAVSMSGEEEGVPEIRAAPGDPPLLPVKTGSSPGTGAAGVVPGVTFNSGVVLTPVQRTVIVTLRARVPASIPIHVTSGLRTAEKQAAALVIKRSRGENLYSLYSQDDLVAEVMKVANTTEAMAAVFRAQMARGRYLSPHMTGVGLDFRTYKWSSDQYKAFEAVAKSLGLSTLRESDHLHMQGMKGWKPPTTAGATLAGASRPSPRRRPPARRSA